MMQRFSLAVPAVLLLLLGCSDDDPVGPSSSSDGASGPGGSGAGASSGSGGAGGGGGSGNDGGAAPFDYASGSWSIENVSNTADTISHDGSLVILGGDSAAVAFSEPDSEVFSDQDIWIATREGGSWTSEPITSDVGIQNAFPSMLGSADGALHLVYNGYPDGLNEIYHRSAVGGVWSDAVDLTGGFEGAGTGRSDYSPWLAMDPRGKLAVAYASEPTDDTGDTTGPPEIRVVFFDDTGALGPPVTAIAAAGDGCFDPRAVFDAAGALHVVADCGVFGAEDLYHATDATSGWASSAFTDASTDDYSATIALAPDGETVHVAWVAEGSCGASACRKLLHARIGASGASAPVEIVDPAQIEGGAPTLGVDVFARPVVAFHVLGRENFADVMVTWSEDGGATFATPRNLTPDTPSSDEWFAASLVFDATTGTPQLTFEAVLAGTDPLDAEVMRAVYVPD